jgi:hypothetical protein
VHSEVQCIVGTVHSGVTQLGRHLCKHAFVAVEVTIEIDTPEIESIDLQCIEVSTVHRESNT